MSRVGIFIDATTGNLGIGTSAPRQYFDIQGGNAIVSGNIGIGTTIPRQRLDIQGATIISGNVGIGTTSPQVKLHVNGSLLGVPPCVIIEDQKASGTPGGTSTVTSWNTRTLNTIVLDTIGIGSLSANTFTLPAGTYDISASAPTYAATRHRIRLYNVSNSTTLLLGTSEYNVSGAAYPVTRSFINRIFTIASSTQLRIDHYIQSGKATDGLGVEASTGDIEIYTTVKIVKLA